MLNHRQQEQQEQQQQRPAYYCELLCTVDTDNPGFRDLQLSLKSLANLHASRQPGNILLCCMFCKTQGTRT
jgi:hypothetical protein